MYKESILVNKLKNKDSLDNKILERLQESAISSSLKTINTAYSRMHNRHNRSSK